MKDSLRFGMDRWQITESFKTFSKIVITHRLSVYHVQVNATTIIFDAPWYSAYKIRRLFPSATYQSSSGLVRYLRLEFIRIPRLVGLIVLCAILFLSSKYIVQIKIDGDDSKIRENMKTNIVTKYPLPLSINEGNRVIESVQKQYKDECQYVSGYRQGSVLKFFFLANHQQKQNMPSKQTLVAQKDGVIAYYDLKHGIKTVPVGSVVKKGDVLVDQKFYDRSNQPQEEPVSGRVFAYVWKDVTVTIKKEHLPKAMQYFLLLFHARIEVSKSFKKDDRIEHENILQFEEDMGKIKMVVHYTLIQDITSPS